MIGKANRLILLTLLFVIGILSIATAKTVAQSAGAQLGENLLVNPGFESGMSGWRRNFATSGAVHAIDDNVAFDGARSLRFASDDVSYRGTVIQVVDVIPGATYRFGYSRKLENVSDTGRHGAHVRIQFKDADGKDTETLQTFGRRTGSFDWQSEEYTVTIPPNTARIYFEIMMDRATGTVWWDDFYLFRESSGQACGCTESVGENLIANGGFDDINERVLPVGFNTFIPSGTPEGTVQIVSDMSRARSGSYSVRIDSENQRAAIARPVRLEGGRAYRLSVWYQASEGMSYSDVVVRVMSYRATPHNQSNKIPWNMAWVHEPYESVYQVSGDNLMIMPHPDVHGEGEWAPIVVEFTLPQEVIGIDIHLFNSNGYGSVWFDDLSFVQLSSDAVKPLPPDTAGPSLSTLRETHPRILVTHSDFERIKTSIDEDPLPRQWYSSLKLAADRILLESPAPYSLPDGKRLLATSREVLQRVETLAMMYRLDEDVRYLERLWQELLSAANFPDWNPSHFLDTAELTRAFGIAYDWLYDSWSREQRNILRDTIVEKGLEPALIYYRGGPKPPGWQWSPSWVQNWNFVVNGGISIGALAIAEEIPDIAEEVVREAYQSLTRAIGLFGPDGAWDEGVGYWHYSIRFLIPYIIALETALGTDYGLSQTPGIPEAGFFPIYLTSPTNEVFNFGDAGTGVPRAPEMFWLAEQFDQPAFAGWHRQIGGSWGSLTNNLLWYSPGLGEDFEMTDLPLDKYFRKVEVSTFRSSWNDRDALFLAFKGGEANVNHGHLDLGDFVFDALGVRWAEETGADNYNLPGYNNRGSGQRWTYYRTRAEGQNTLVINPGSEPDQDVRAFAQVIQHSSQDDEAWAIVDLSSAYRDATRVWRGFALLDERRQVLIQDEISALEPVDLWWFMHTRADIVLSDDGKIATLQRGGKELMARILSPVDARFDVMDARPLPTSPDPEGQAGNLGIRKLAIHLEGHTDVRLVVQLIPLSEGEIAPVLPRIIPLSQWNHTTQAQGRIWSALPRMTVDLVSPVPSDKIHGIIPIQMRIETPDTIEVEKAMLLLGGEVIHQEDQLFQEVLLDTNRWEDGLHSLQLEMRLPSGEVGFRRFPLRIENWWTLDDPFDPPHTSGWLGTIDRSKTYATSDGWGYATESRDHFFGDNGRRVRLSPTTEYLIWETPNLREYQISLYTPLNNVEHIVILEVSPDGNSWKKIAYETEIRERTGQGLNWLDVLGEVTGQEEMRLFRLTLRRSDGPEDEIQLGRARFRGRHASSQPGSN